MVVALLSVARLFTLRVLNEELVTLKSAPFPEFTVTVLNAKALLALKATGLVKLVSELAPTLRVLVPAVSVRFRLLRFTDPVFACTRSVVVLLPRSRVPATVLATEVVPVKVLSVLKVSVVLPKLTRRAAEMLTMVPDVPLKGLVNVQPPLTLSKSSNAPNGTPCVSTTAPVAAASIRWGTLMVVAVAIVAV